jgi:hypothetical protein
VRLAHELVLFGRCCAAVLMYRVAHTALMLALRTLPVDHPGRIYAVGRVEEGDCRIREAVSFHSARVFRARFRST